MEVKDFESSLQPSARGGLFDRSGPARDLRPHTIRHRVVGIRYVAAALVQTGTAVEDITSLADLVRIDNLKRALNWHWQRAGGVVTDHVISITATLRILAKYHVALTDAERASVLLEIAKVKHKKHLRMAASREKRIQKLDDPDTEARLLHIARLIMNEAKGLLELGQHAEAGWLAGVALAISILLRCPLRMTNIASLRLGVELVKLDARSKVFTDILVDGNRTKNGEPAYFPIGRDLARAIDEYVVTYRCHVPNSDTVFLFPNRDHADRPRASGGMGRAISEVIHHYVGVRVTPHDFRAFAGMQMLRDNAGAINDLRLILGHKDLATTSSYYASLQPKQAAERYNQLIDRKQGQTKLTAKASFAKLGKRQRTKLVGKPPEGRR